MYPLYCRFDNLIRKCNRREQGCQSFRFSFVYYLYYSLAYCPPYILSWGLYSALFMCAIYCRFDNLIRYCNIREQGCPNFGCSFVYYLYYSNAYCPQYILSWRLLYIQHYSCVPYTVGLITLLGNVTEKNRVAKIIA